ncbi:MAG: amidohydrolase family protein, partial [Chloroflexi bacterium]|nr:amidohydrolase family protein [Chloroflexota bacterium]
MKKRTHLLNWRFVSLLFLILSLILSACAPAPTTESATQQPSAIPPQPDRPVEFPPPVPGGRADVIFVNGAILTMDNAIPGAQALAIQGNAILAVGSIQEVFAHRGEGTRVVDLEGKTLVPRCIDSHSHRINGGIDGRYDLEATIEESIAQGWTSLSEKYVPPDKMPEYLEFIRQDNLRLRVNMYLANSGALGEPLGDWYKVYRQDQVFSPRWRIAGMKIFTGINNDTQLLWTQDELNALLLARHQEGWHLAIKTVSTETLEMILTALENIEKTDPSIVNRRVTLEHALFLTPEQIARVRRLGLIPSIQTNMPGELVGEQDIEELTARQPRGSAFPWRNLFSAGVIVAGGSSFPTYYVDEPSGAPFGSPVHLIYQAVTRVGNLGTQPEAWMLDQT